MELAIGFQSHDFSLTINFRKLTDSSIPADCDWLLSKFANLTVIGATFCELQHAKNWATGGTCGTCVLTVNC
jgi:hypothetical protein